MAETKGTDQPITRHPLFPAIVALWFGALAGLGSVIVSSSTIEGIVLALEIDKVIPMAAPPLGTTMRILLALAMTGVGAAIGGLIARRMARPADSIETPGEDADAAETASSQTGPSQTGPSQTAGAGTAPRRRRALAIEPEAVLPSVDEAAPLPGRPNDARILNVADFDIDSFDEAPDADAPLRRPIQAEPAATADHAEDDNLPAWLDTESAWLEADDSQPVRGVFTTPPGAQIFQAELEAAEKAAAENTETPVGSRLFEAYSREFSSRPDADVDTDVESDVSAASESGENSLTGAAGEPEQPGFSLLPRLPQGDWTAENDAGYPVSAMQAAEPEDSAWDSPVPPFATPATEETIAASFTHPDPQVDPQAPFAAPAPYASFDLRGAADRIVDADLGTLSQVELLERLALAMQRRREEAQRAAEEAALAPAPVTQPFAAPVIEPVADAAPDQPAWSAAVPDALRPIALDPIADTASDAADPLSGYMPARQIGLSPVAGAHQGDDPLAAAAPFPSSPFSADTDDGDEDPVLQQGYSSLLNLSRNGAVRKPFLQFGEPDTEGDQIAHATSALPEADEQQPVFGRPVLLPDPVGEAPPEQEERPFDAPRNDPDATERALRAALATLQRMSGAA